MYLYTYIHTYNIYIIYVSTYVMYISLYMYVCMYVCVTCVKGDQAPYILRLDNLAKPKDAPVHQEQKERQGRCLAAQYGINNLVSPNKKKSKRLRAMQSLLMSGLKSVQKKRLSQRGHSKRV